MALLLVPGVSNVIVEFQDGLAEVVYNPEQTSIGALVLAVQATGDGGHHNFLAQWIE